MTNGDGNSIAWVKLISDSARNFRDQRDDPSSDCTDWEICKMGSIKNSRLLLCSWIVSNSVSGFAPKYATGSWGGQDRSLALSSCSFSASRSLMLLVMSVWDFHYYELCPSRKSLILYQFYAGVSCGRQELYLQSVELLEWCPQT